MSCSLVLILSATILLLIGAAAAPVDELGTVAPDTQPGRFSAVDVYIDPAGKPLAAYQFELSARGPAVTLVGVEGGESSAFADPPYYDPRANALHRVIIAAFNTGKDLPRGKTRVARIMLHIDGPQDPQYSALLQEAVSSDAEAIAATITVSESEAAR